MSAKAGAEELCGKIRIKVHWESQSFARSPEDEPRFFLRDVFGHNEKVRHGHGVVIYVYVCIQRFVSCVCVCPSVCTSGPVYFGVRMCFLCVRAFCAPFHMFTAYVHAAFFGCLGNKSTFVGRQFSAGFWRTAWWPARGMLTAPLVVWALMPPRACRHADLSFFFFLFFSSCTYPFYMLFMYS